MFMLTVNYFLLKHFKTLFEGRVCISILHPPGDDPMGYESATERWSPVQNVEKILLSVMSMLAEPNCESGKSMSHLSR